MKLHLASFFSFLKKNPFPNKEDIISIRNSKISTSKTILVISIFFCIVSFLSILMYISAIFSQEVPEYGGTITEGVIGAPRYINPLLASSETDQLLTDLVYSGLMRRTYDGTLVTDIATKCELSSENKSYKCTLPESITFSDKSPLSSSDILFTYITKQNIVLSNNPTSDWSLISIEAIDEKTIVIKTSGKLESLEQKMTLGIIPESLWSNIPIETLEDSQLNMSPIGAGPFIVHKIKVTNTIPTEVDLKTNPKWIKSRPYIDTLVIKSFANQLDLKTGLKNGTIDSTSSLRGTFVDQEIKNNFNIDQIATYKDVGLFIRNSQINSSSGKILKSISPLIDRKNIIDNIENGYGTVLNSQDTDPSNTTSQILEISIAVQKDTDLIKTAELLSTELNSFGIIATINVFDQGLFNEQLNLGQYPLVLGINIDENQDYQSLLPLYTKSLIHLSNKDIHVLTPKILESPHESLREVSLWYKNTDFIWKWFIHK